MSSPLLVHSRAMAISHNPRELLGACEYYWLCSSRTHGSNKLRRNTVFIVSDFGSVAYWLWLCFAELICNQPDILISVLETNAVAYVMRAFSTGLYREILFRTKYREIYDHFRLVLGLDTDLFHHIKQCFIPGIHDDVIIWKRFPRYWPFVRRIHRSTVNSPHKGQWRRALIPYWSAPE